MSYLALDTSLSGCHVAVLHAASGKLFEKHEQMDRGQSERFVPLIVEMMAQADLDFVDIKAVIALNGPGSFTGLRVGLSTARTIVQTTNCLGIGLSGFDAFRFSIPDQNTAIIIESRRDDFYASILNRDCLMQPQTLLTEFENQPLLFLGDGVERFFSYLGEKVPAHWHNKAVTIPPLGEILKHYASGGVLAQKPLSPYYLREPDVTLKQAAR